MPDHASPGGAYLAAMSLTALGVVYGDIGTSPLYAVREGFLEEHGVLPTAANVLGVLSLILWALVVIVSVKYLVFVLRADNKGEGGILALTTLVTPVGVMERGRRYTLILLGLFGAALLYGDGMITPSISVLSAIEGLEVATPLFEPYILPITIAVLVAMFAFQSHGTARVGRVFGPVMVLWFGTIAVLGIRWILVEPEVLGAVNPAHGVAFFLENRWNAFFVLGSVFLVVTGGEALYADMGHLGRQPIRLAWFGFVLPALLVNYFGQGALLIVNPAAVASPFYSMPPAWAVLPVVLIATAATVIASQALISGAFSLTRQAVLLGYFPRVNIAHTSAREIGQIYIPAVNWFLMFACIGLVLGFQSSSNLAAAYGLAITMTMTVTTLLLSVVARERWGWSLPLVVAVVGLFLVIDLAFLGANLLKLPEGGWFPLVIGAIGFTLLTTWKTGRRILSERMQSRTLPRELFVKEVEERPPHRVPGTAVFMYRDRAGTPPALLHSLKHYGVLHEQIIFLSVDTAEVPYVDEDERVDVTRLGAGLYQVVVNTGFMQQVDVPAVLMSLDVEGLSLKPMTMSYFLGRETILATRNPGMALWREKLFAAMAQNARPASAFFNLPPNRVVEVGAQIEF
jgi:KUP system potassium uptake protein